MIIGRTGLALLAVLAAGSAQAVRVPAPDPANGDGGVSSFYTWTEEIPPQPGRLLRSEPLDPSLGVPGAARQLRILYTSTNGVDGATPVVVSGALFLPHGAPPPGGWKLIAWAHGTTGLADICAPSWQGRSSRDRSYLGEWLAQGYAVVATDYQGLGTPGPHPYVLARPEAYSVLDSIRAVLQGGFGLANRAVVVGQSQGAGAAFATGGIAPAYAPEIAVEGVVATGLPYPSAPPPRPPTGEAATQGNHVFAYYLYIALTLQQSLGLARAEDLVTAKARPALEDARGTCVSEMFRTVMASGLNTANGPTPAYRDAYVAALPALRYPTLALKMPVFVGTGAEDHDVRPSAQLRLVRDACAAGTVLQAHLYTGLSHSAAVNGSLPDSLPFVRRIFAGETITPVCEPVAQ
ncbi:MAG: lipase family protein [Acetobacteraceae bacterium]